MNDLTALLALDFARLIDSDRSIQPDPKDKLNNFYLVKDLLDNLLSHKYL